MPPTTLRSSAQHAISLPFHCTGGCHARAHSMNRPTAAMTKLRSPLAALSVCLPRGPSILHKYPCAHQSASSPIKFTMTANHRRRCSINPSTIQSDSLQLHSDHALRPANPVATVRLDRTAHRAASNHQSKTNKRRRGPRGSASLVVSFRPRLQRGPCQEGPRLR
ncbi:uncharacterized protein J3D65DRAFT_42439 [Phyllosticta citribraziliensis]|uniref:Uncharacterized protein n=1 Tax=Phyllosticta citribraziliensis TaxID=989973 RepID=A0ABR1MBT8_9PEZI